jgi:hypothetical protein
MSKEKPTAQSFLDNCQYISNDEDTVYIDEEALTDCMKQYANQRVIEELEEQVKELGDNNLLTALSIPKSMLLKRIKELKQK